MDTKTKELFKECLRDVWQYKFLTIARFANVPQRLLSVHAIPLASAALIDAATRGTLEDEWRLFLGIILCAEIVRYGLHFITFKANAKLNHYTRPHREARNLGRVLNLPYEVILNKSSGQLAAQANNRSGYIQQFLDYSTLSIETLVTSTFAVIIIFSRSWIFALTYLAMLIVGMIYLGRLARKRVEINKNSNSAWEELNGEFNDVVQNSQNVITNHAYAEEKERHDSIATNLWERGMVRWYYAVFQGNSVRLFGLIVSIVYLCLGLYLLLDDQITIGTFVLFQSYIGMTMANIDTIVALIRNFSEETTKALSLDYTEEKANYLPEPDQPMKPRDNSIEFENVHFTYEDTNMKALKDVSFKIKQGESVGIVGKSGSGKTTITKMLVRFYDPNSGTVRMGQYDTKELGTKNVRDLVSYVPQDPILFRRSIKDNISYAAGKKVGAKDIDKALNQAYLSEFIKDLPEGVDTIVGDRGIKLSGGQRQRVAIARAIVKDAPILVFDEATSALDSESESIIQKALRSVMKNRTAIVVAHRLSTLKHMDRIVVMDKGKVVEDGTHAELIKKGGIYSDLWNHQSDGFIE